jgi:hypothetical protein
MTALRNGCDATPSPPTESRAQMTTQTVPDPATGQQPPEIGEVAKHWIDGEWIGSHAVSEPINPATGAYSGGG